MSESWYSDAALAKQARIDASGPDAPISLDDICGVYEPRTQPEPHERCNNCRMDARDQVGGELIDGQRWCGLCIARERHLDD